MILRVSYDYRDNLILIVVSFVKVVGSINVIGLLTVFFLSKSEICLGTISVTLDRFCSNIPTLECIAK